MSGDDKLFVYLYAACTDLEGSTMMPCGAIVHVSLRSESTGMFVAVIREATHTYKDFEEGVMGLNPVIEETIRPKLEAIKEEARAEGRAEANADNAVGMVQEGIGIATICRVTSLSEAEVLNLAAEKGLSIAP